jgi:hypothetical protein
LFAHVFDHQDNRPLIKPVTTDATAKTSWCSVPAAENFMPSVRATAIKSNKRRFPPSANRPPRCRYRHHGRNNYFIRAPTDLVFDGLRLLSDDRLLFGLLFVRHFGLLLVFDVIRWSIVHAHLDRVSFRASGGSTLTLWSSHLVSFGNILLLFAPFGISVRSPRYRFDSLRSDDKRMVHLMHTWIQSKRDYGVCSVETKFTFKGDSVTSGTQCQLFLRTDCRYFRLAGALGGKNVSLGEMAGEMHEGIPVPRPSTER